ncbi:DUF4381 domain-containing protein [Pseudomonas sp. N040]|uniref:DUF4381 domain-containing protein n=1 Tax=Pseudomonas sp. N040 TaxID=2785325 RepID=UPI0018A32D48|nr:DUF4381 domain-containing protein [Pseudomonas sp. N040]MBF7729248.1 DUF4381 domain-containing protein [Pseudomonas sp. N040]MBW7012888.1 DUF4381 domain-containing protein [Pseudomonas sp. N040]
MSAAANISQLQVLPLPEPVSYFPQTWGWLALLLLLLGTAVLFGGRALWRWRCNRYRRAALTQLVQLQAALTSNTDRSPLRQLPDLLKRTALSIPGQVGVSSLGGCDWQRFLEQCCPAPLPADFSAQLAMLSYAPDAQLQALSEQQIADLLGVSRQWLEQHHVAV